MLNKCLSVFCGKLTCVLYVSATATVGNSSAAKVCNAKRDFPDCTVKRLFVMLSDTSCVSGSARKISSSLRAATVVAVTSLPEPISACVLICTSISVDKRVTLDPSLRMRILARIGNVCRRSTIPLTICRGRNNASLVAFTNCIVFSFRRTIQN